MSNVKELDERKGWTSASNAAYDLRCAGRHQAQKGAPPVIDVSADATFGTLIHDALSEGDPSKLNPEQLSIYESCVEIRDKLIEKVFGLDAPNIKTFKEERFWAHYTVQPGDRAPNPKRYSHSGKVDWLGRMGTKGLLIEYKSLPGDLDGSESNEQLRDQAVLAARNVILKDVYVAIVQPLVTHDPTVTHYDSAAITQAELEMSARIRNSNSVDAKRTPNPMSCKFCTAANSCLEYQSWVSKHVVEMQPVTGVPVAQWTPQQRAHFMSMRGIASKWLDDCYAEMKRIAKTEPDAVPGYGLKAGAVLKPIVKPQELFDRFHTLAHDFAMKECNGDEEAASTMITELFMSCVEVGKSPVEAMVRKVTGLKGKALNAKMEELLAGLIEPKPNEPSLSKLRG